MNRLAALSFSAIALLAVACAAPSDDESPEGVVDEAELKVAATSLSKSYEGTFAVRGASYGVKVTYTYPSSAISWQTQGATNFHLNSGFCHAFMEPLPVTVRTVVTNARGAVVADDTKSVDSEPTSQFVEDRATRCPNGFFAQAAAVPSLPALIASSGVALTLEGEAVQIPLGGYTPAGTFAVEATASFRPLTAVRSERKKTLQAFNPDGSKSFANSETLTVDRGVVTLSLPAEMRTRIGFGVGPHGFGTTIQDVVLRAR